MKAKKLKKFKKIIKNILLVNLLPTSFLFGFNYLNTNQVEDNKYFLNENFNIDDVILEDKVSSYDITIAPKKEIDYIKTISDGYNNIEYSKEFTSNYFKNLSSNKPSNYDGICGYTSLSMLLSFYDVYFNDDIIDNKYQTGMYVTSIKNYDDSSSYQSAGVYDRYVSINPYILDLEKNKNNYLIGYDNENKPIYNDEYKRLYGICVEKWLNAIIDSNTFLGYLVKLSKDNDNISKDKKGNYKGLGIGASIENKLIKLYLENSKLNGYATNFYYARKNENNNSLLTENELRMKIISYLQKGQPVIVGGTTSSNSGHVFIAYEYDEENDIIYGNAGWGSNYNHVNIEKDIVVTIDDFFGIDVSSNLVHKHSTFYKNFDETNFINSYLCSCNLKSHNHNYFYVSYDANRHYQRCFCGSSTLDNHTFDNEILRNNKYYYECKYCNYLKESSSGVILNPYL